MALNQIVDGFSYNTQLIYFRERFFPNALEQMDTLRRAANYRARWWTVPQKINNPISPYDTLYEQIEVAGNSYFWGYMFAALSATDPDDAPTETTATDLLVNCVDSCSTIPLFMDFANGGGLHSNFTTKAVPIILTQPRVILDPGLINVEIANRTANTITCQLLMLFCEPCRVITEETREIDWKLATMKP